MKTTWDIKRILKDKESFDELSEDEKVAIGRWAFRREDLTHMPNIPKSFTSQQENIVFLAHSWYVYDYAKLMPKFGDK